MTKVSPFILAWNFLMEMKEVAEIRKARERMNFELKTCSDLRPRIIAEIAKQRAARIAKIRYFFDFGAS